MNFLVFVGISTVLLVLAAADFVFQRARELWNGVGGKHRTVYLSVIRKYDCTSQKLRKWLKEARRRRSWCMYVWYGSVIIHSVYANRLLFTHCTRRGMNDKDSTVMAITIWSKKCTHWMITYISQIRVEKKFLKLAENILNS